jgi:signal transduction histidine kinase
VAMMSNALAKKLRTEDSDVVVEAERMAELLAGAVAQTRALAKGLHPVELDKSGLTAALRELTVNLNPQIRCELALQAPVPVADSATALHLYRIAQEATTNALKHARADRVIIRLGSKNSNVVLSIADNGEGFSRAFSRAKGMGLHIMGYRARLIGGSLSINTRRGRGTVITCTVPNAVEHE